MRSCNGVALSWVGACLPSGLLPFLLRLLPLLSYAALLCADTGGLVETANERARLALWYGLQVRVAAIMPPDQPVMSHNVHDAAWVLALPVVPRAHFLCVCATSTIAPCSVLHGKLFACTRSSPQQAGAPPTAPQRLAAAAAAAPRRPRAPP
jgi:hypothetical protein